MMRSSVLWVAVAFGCAREPSITDDSPADDRPTPFANDNDADGYEPPFDCDDGDAQVYPGHGEFCNGKDDDCDGATDEDAVDGNDGFVDADGDKAGDSSLPLVACLVPGWAPSGGDCDDSDPARSPGFTEACNGIDDDCDGLVDSGAFLGQLHVRSIQAAVVAASVGDTIELCPGSTHDEGAIVVDRDVTVTTRDDGVPAVVDGSIVNAAVFVVDGGDLTLDGVTLRGGRGTFGNVFELGNVRAGGAVNAISGQGGHVTVRNSVLEGNEAVAGGAIAAITLDVSDSTFVANVADDPGRDAPGGAVWIAPFGSFAIERTTFDGNVADVGGAVQTWSSGTLTDIEGRDNVAVVGGFLRAETQVAPPTTVDLVRADIHHNTAEVGAGLALVYASGTADADSLIHENEAELCAGVHVVSVPTFGRLSWSGGTVEANQADPESGHGGGLCVDAALGGTVEVEDVVIRENGASLGGGIHVLAIASADLSLRDLVVEGNLATDGAGIAAEGADGLPAEATIWLEDDVIASNVAAGSGGGLWASDAHLGLASDTVRDNVAAQGGGAYLTLAGALDVLTTDFVGNVPDDVWLEAYGATYEAADVGATFTCAGADATCQ